MLDISYANAFVLVFIYDTGIRDRDFKINNLKLI